MEEGAREILCRWKYKRCSLIYRIAHILRHEIRDSTPPLPLARDPRAETRSGAKTTLDSTPVPSLFTEDRFD